MLGLSEEILHTFLHKEEVEFDKGPVQPCYIPLSGSRAHAQDIIRHMRALMLKEGLSNT